MTQQESTISRKAAKGLPVAPARRLTAVPLLYLIAAIVLGAPALYRVGRAFYTLTARPLEGSVALDLKLRYEEVHEWMAGRPVYGVIHTAMYPPATYIMLWPLMGWTTLSIARFIWAATCLLALVLLLRIAVVEGMATACGGVSSTGVEGTPTPALSLSTERGDKGKGVAQRWELQLLVVAALISNYAVSIAVSVGQLPLQSVVAVVGALLVTVRTPRSLSRDLLGAALFVAAMVKPQIAIPFWWVLLLTSGRMRPALIAVVVYLALTLLAVSFQGSTISSQDSQVWAPHVKQFEWAATHGMRGYGNLDIWLASAGFPNLILPAWIAVMGGLGVWVFFHRRSDIWIVMGVAALVARMWAYHRDYDDVLLLIPLVTLWRLAWNGPSRGRYGALVLLALLVLVMVYPATAGGSVPWNGQVLAGRVAVWIGILGYFMWVARRANIAASAPLRRTVVA